MGLTSPGVPPHPLQQQLGAVEATLALTTPPLRPSASHAEMTSGAHEEMILAHEEMIFAGLVAVRQQGELTRAGEATHARRPPALRVAVAATVCHWETDVAAAVILEVVVTLVVTVAAAVAVVVGEATTTLLDQHEVAAAATTRPGAILACGGGHSRPAAGPASPLAAVAAAAAAL